MSGPETRRSQRLALSLVLDRDLGAGRADPAARGLVVEANSGDLRRYVRLLRRDELAGWAAVGKDLRALGLDRTEAAEVRRQIRSLKPLVKAARKPLRRAVDLKHKHDREPRPCKTCREMLPHSQDAWRRHMAKLRQRWAFLNSPLGKPGDPGPYAKREKAIQRRIGVFAEEAPQAAKVLGPAGIRAIVERIDTCQRYVFFRRWVQIHYGGSPLRRNGNRESTRPLDQIKGHPGLKITYPQPVWVRKDGRLRLENTQ